MSTAKTKKNGKSPGKESPAPKSKTGTKKAAATEAQPKPAGPSQGRVFFVTGYPGFIGKRLVEALARRYLGAKIYVLVQEKFERGAELYVEDLRACGDCAQIEVLVGDIIDIDLGLSGEEYKRLVEEVTDVFHLAAINYLGVRAEIVRRVNVEGTRRVIELCRDLKRLRRLNHMSTAFVSGSRQGIIAEDELELGQSFRNPYEETKYQAEVLVQDAAAHLPVSIYRPSIVVGDSNTGEIDRLDGPYYLGILLVTSPLAVPLPLPGDTSAPLNVVPVDFVIDAMLALSEHPEAEGEIFHLVDPNPMSSRRVYERIAESTGKRMPRLNLSYRMTDTLMRLPVVERLIRQQRQAVAYVNHLAIYNSHNTQRLLDGSGVRCPPLHSYLDRLIEYARAYYRARHGEEGPEASDAALDEARA